MNLDKLYFIPSGWADNKCNQDFHVFDVEDWMPENHTIECQCGAVIKLLAWVKSNEVAGPDQPNWN